MGGQVGKRQKFFPGSFLSPILSFPAQDKIPSFLRCLASPSWGKRAIHDDKKETKKEKEKEEEDNDDQGSPGMCVILSKIFTLFRPKSVIFSSLFLLGRSFQHLCFHTVSRSLSPAS